MIQVDLAIFTNIAQLIGSIGVIIGFLFTIFKLMHKIDKMDSDLKKVKKEQCIIIYCLSAILDGLEQNGANGEVTKAKEKLSIHINKQAHEVD